MKTGIYTITNKTTGKIYVGSTHRTFKRRWYEHKNDLRNNKHYNKHLQRAWDKYGENDFLFEILEECETQFCESLELYWMNLLGTLDKNYGYNPMLPMIRGSVYPLKVREKMSRKAIERGCSHLHSPEMVKENGKKLQAWKESNPKFNPRKNTGKYGVCEKYDINWNFIKKFNSVYNVFPLLNLPNASHLMRASKNGGMCKGFRWKVYYKDSNKLVY